MITAALCCPTQFSALQFAFLSRNGFQVYRTVTTSTEVEVRSPGRLKQATGPILCSSVPGLRSQAQASSSRVCSFPVPACHPDWSGELHHRSRKSLAEFSQGQGKLNQLGFRPTSTRRQQVVRVLQSREGSGSWRFVSLQSGFTLAGR